MIALPPTYAPIPDTVAEREKLIRALGFEVDDPSVSGILKAQYVLVNNDGPEKWRCQWCNVRHAEYTRQCIPLPWRGLEHALYGYWNIVGQMRPGDLTPAQNARLAQLSRFFGRGTGTVSLAQSDPRTVREMKVSERDAVRGATVLGSLKEISAQKARFYAELIRARGDVCQL